MTNGWSLPVQDNDWVVVEATPEQMLVQGSCRSARTPVFLHPLSKEEYALARTERKTARGYTPDLPYMPPTLRSKKTLRDET